VNLPNAITVGRIALTPLIAWLPFSTSWTARLIGFTLFLVAAITDWWDGHIARTQNLVTDLGRVLDPLADKLLLVATLVPMYVLQAHYTFITPLEGVLPEPSPFLFVTPFGLVSLPGWIVAVVIGREIFMTIFRWLASRRGLVISSIGPAKFKTGFQSVWTGAAFFWFFARTLAGAKDWLGETWWQYFEHVNGLTGTFCMVASVGLTLWSLVLYLIRYGPAYVDAGKPRG
jgi:phosphatidylglycerophosphate synthase